MATSNTPGAASTASDHEEEEEQVSELEEDPMLPLYALMAAGSSYLRLFSFTANKPRRRRRRRR